MGTGLLNPRVDTSNGVLGFKALSGPGRIVERQRRLMALLAPYPGLSVLA